MVAAAQTEDQLIQRAQAALSKCNWEIGECAAEWTSRYARGRTDADFGALIGLSGDQVFQRRRVWETFADVQGEYQHLKWSHFYAAVNWDDAAESLQWASDLGATVAEMKAWRRAQRGEDLTRPADEEAPFGADDEPMFLPVGEGYVQQVDSLGGSSGPGESSRRGTGKSEREELATAVARESDGGYAPFGKRARGAAAAGDSSAAPPLQILKRMAATLEKVDAALTPSVLEALSEAPVALQQRLQSVVGKLEAKFADWR
jgi:hypothetical protein